MQKVCWLALAGALWLWGCSDDGGSSGGGSGGEVGGEVGGSAGGGGGPENVPVGPADIVTSAKYKKLTVEVDYMTGSEPGPEALSRVSSQLESLRTGGYLGKPDGIEIALDEELPPSGDPETVHTFKELDALAKAHRTRVPAKGEAVLHMLYVDGHYEDDESESYVLGYAYGGSTIVMLADNIARSCEGLPLISKLAPGIAAKVCQLTESTVLLHELGHLFGLVNNGTAMVEPHQDEAHGKHDSNEECIMFWLNERSSVADLILERVQKGKEDVVPFDEECLQDLAAAQAP